MAHSLRLVGTLWPCMWPWVRGPPRSVARAPDNGNINAGQSLKRQNWSDCYDR